MSTEIDYASQFIPILPEIWLVLAALLVLALDTVTKSPGQKRTLGVLAAGGLLGAAAIAVFFWPSVETSGLAWGGMIRYDAFTSVFRIIFYLAAAFTCVASVDMKSLRPGGEFYSLVIFSTIGMAFMAMANDLVMLYLATETASIAQYLLAGFQRNSKRSAEAGIKYFVFGAVTSTVMLYGLSLLYGMGGGSTGYANVATQLANPEFSLLAIFAVVLVMAGFAFKISAVPFHFWSPDVYQGAPATVTGFISTASKAAGFAVLLRFTASLFPNLATDVATTWVSLIQPLAIMTMLLGTLLAIMQTNVKRMMAYSSITQAGYVLMAVVALIQAPDPSSVLASIVFYLGTYMLANVAAFSVIGMVYENTGGDDLKHFAGLSRRNPYLALGMASALLSLLGAPFMVGFVGKLFLFRGVLSLGNTQAYILMGVAIFSVLTSIWYYMGVVKAMYVDRSEDDDEIFVVPVPTGFVVMMTSIGVIFTTLISGPLWSIALDAAKAFLA